MKNWHVSVVTVTYGDRFHYLQRQIKHGFEEGVDRIVIVDNNSDRNSKEKIASLEDPRIEVIHLYSNTGSAHGFRRGIIEAIKYKKNGFIWLLDDDNIPLAGSLAALKRQWEKEAPKNTATLSLLSYRQDRSVYLKAVQENKPSLMIGPKNSFRGFHIANITNKLLARITNPKSNNSQLGSRYCGKVSVAPYSGMFFHASLTHRIGLPDPRYFVYGDDYDFSYRITKKSGLIKLVCNSKLQDLETSWHLIPKKRFESSLLNCDDPFKIYYGLRNCVYFESTFRTTCKPIYYINMGIYLLLICFVSLFRKQTNVKLIIKAVQDGLRNRLGKRDYLR